MKRTKSKGIKMQTACEVAFILHCIRMIHSTGQQVRRGGAEKMSTSKMCLTSVSSHFWLAVLSLLLLLLST